MNAASGITASAVNSTTNEVSGIDRIANEVSNSNLLGFIEIESLVFGEKTSLVVDPSEEKIKTEFEGVKRTYVPMHSVLRIDEVDEQGVSKVSKAEGGNVTQMPNTVFVPDDKSKS